MILEQFSLVYNYHSLSRLLIVRRSRQVWYDVVRTREGGRAVLDTVTIPEGYTRLAPRAGYVPRVCRVSASVFLSASLTLNDNIHEQAL